MKLTAWEITCIEYALADLRNANKNQADRKDLFAGADSAYKKIKGFINEQEQQLSPEHFMDYSGELSATK